MQFTCSVYILSWKLPLETTYVACGIIHSGDTWWRPVATRTH